MKALWIWGLCWGCLTACGRAESYEDPSDGTTGHTTADTGPTTTGHTTADTGPTTTTMTTTTTTTTTGHDNPPECPSSEPYPLTDCSPEGLECDYNDCSFPDFLQPSRVACLSGRWERTLLGECQAPLCPAQQPLIGSYCDGSRFVGPCPLIDGCLNLRPIRCVDGTWQGDGSAVTTGSASGTTGVIFGVPCPDIPPAVGSLCCPGQHAANCNYEAFATTGGAVAAGTGPGGPLPPGPVTPCVSCTTDGVWRESSGCN